MKTKTYKSKSTSVQVNLYIKKNPL